MEEEILNVMIDEILLDENKKINENWSLEEYLRSFRADQLTILAVVYVWKSRNYIELIKIKNMAKKKKDNAINYVLENMNEIIKTYIKVLPTEILNQLKKISKSDGVVSYNIYENLYSLHFLLFLKRNALGRVYFDNKNDIINIYIPSEFKNIIKDALNDKNIIKENNKNNKIYKFTLDCMDTYGILTMDELYRLCSKFKLGINIDELNTILNSYLFVDEGFNLYEYEDSMLVANLEFDYDEATNFYENNTYNLNEKLTLNDIENIGNYKYIHKLKSYKKLINWLDDRYVGIKEDHELIDELIVIDYITSAQTSLDTANKNFKINIDEFLEIDIYEKNIVAKMLEDIFLESPKWSKRGNI